MNLNFGHGILAFYVAFASLLAYQVYKTTTYDHSLVADDYYELDLSHQATLEARARASGHALAFEPVGPGRLRLRFPAALAVDSGRVHLQRPDARVPDVSRALRPGGAAGRVEPTELELLPGAWNARVDYYRDGQRHELRRKLYVR